MKTILTLSLTLTTLIAQAEARKGYWPVWSAHQKNANIYGIAGGVSDFFFESATSNVYGIKISALGEGILVPFIPQSPLPQNDSEFIAARQEPSAYKVNGINVSGSGTFCNCDINGINAGFMGHIVNNVNGVSFAMINIIRQHQGIQFAVMNMTYKIRGIQVGYVSQNYYGQGIIIGLFENYNKQLDGLQLSVWNDNENSRGAQIGIIYNRTEKLKGVQVGVINKSKDTKGLQIGLWNKNEKRTLPFINWNFAKEA